MRRAFLHIGAPKTGTTFVQDVLWRNRERLRSAGLSYPLRRPGEHFEATVDLRRIPWGGRHNPEWDGAWERLAGRARAARSPTVVISNELLAGATPAQAEKAARGMGDAEVHVVLTVRDLARQLPSGWQEHVKHRRTVSLDDFVADCVEGGNEGRFGRQFWRLHDPVDVLARWRAAVPPGRIHVVTVPQRGGGNRRLWERFAGVVGIDHTTVETDVGRANTSLGVVEAELLRRVNAALAGRMANHHYDPVIRIVLAERVLANLPASQPLRLPERHLDWVRARSEQIVAELAAGGYHVVGDLAELLPAPAAAAEPAAEPGESELATVAVQAVAGLLRELEPMRERVRRRGQRPAAAARPGRARARRQAH